MGLLSIPAIYFPQSSVSGSTACVVLLRGDIIYVFNVGDSRAVLAKQQGSGDCHIRYVAVPLSEDQTPSCPKERERIIRSGGHVSEPGGSGTPARVWIDRCCTLVGLAMTRCFGDFNVKHIGVIPDPVVTQRSLEKGDEFLIVATDGVWEFLTPEEAVRLVGEGLDDGMGAQDACQKLVRAAAARWKENEGDYRDDITAIVVRLRGLWNKESESER